MKTFQATDPGLGPGGQASSREHPFQSFQWSDYSAKPEHDYTYRVIPLYGTPTNLQEGSAVSVRIATEPEFGKTHSVFFNRGAIASQEYARRFQNKSPDGLGSEQKQAAFRWLSRGLFEAFETFVSRANGANYGLYGAIYEFQWPEALKAVKAVSDTGADVHIIYDGIPSSTGPIEKNEQAIAVAKIKSLSTPRTTGKIMHNKFFVLTKNHKPVAVWTGSTNLTENGIFGHSNCGHAVENEAIAGEYLNYWNELKGSPASSTERTWMTQNNPNPPNPWNDDLNVVFSPRTGLKVLEWYAEIASAHKPHFMTFAFGMHKDFQEVYEQNDGILRFALMEKEGNGRGLEQGKKDIKRIRALPNVVVAVGKNIVTNSFDRWLAERQKLTAEAHVKFIHTKYMLLDPLGEKPVIVTGSANFSEASTNENNENMLVIRNDKRVADIYVGEFMRLAKTTETTVYALTTHPNGCPLLLTTRVKETNMTRSTTIVSITMLSMMLGGIAVGQPNWTEQGPGPAVSSDYGQISGAIEAIAADPTDPNRVFVGAVNGGIWRTLNASAANPTWTPLTDYLPSLSIGSVNLSPLDANTIFSGFGNFSSFFQLGGTASGIIKSTDGGDTWTVLAQATFSGMAIRRVLPTTLKDPITGKQVVLVAAIGTVGTDGGVFRSVDGGVTFTNALSGPRDACHVTGDPSDAMRFFAGMPGAGIFMSEDGGVTWSCVNGDMPSAAADRIELSVSSVADPITGRNPVYAIVANFPPSMTRVFRSNNLGASWTLLDKPTDPFNTGGGANVHMSILADRTNPNAVFVGEDRGPYWRWNGTSWIAMEGSATHNTREHVDSRDAVFDANGDILESDDGGIYRLVDPNNVAGKRRWMPVIGNIRVTEFFSVAYDTLNHVFLGAAMDNGCPEQAAADAFVSNLNENEGSDGTGVGIDSVTSPGQSLHYSALQYLAQGDFYRRTFDNNNNLVGTVKIPKRVNGTGGKSLSEIDPGGASSVGPNGAQFCTPFILNKVDPSKMLISLGGYLYESTSPLAGDDLEALGGIEPANGDGVDNDNDGQIDEGDEYVPNPKYKIGDVNGGCGLAGAWAYGGVSGGVANPEVLFFGSDSTLFVRSTGRGIPDPITTYRGGFVNDIALDPNEWRRAYVLDNDRQVWRTTDAGATVAGWVNLTANLVNLSSDLRTIEIVGSAVPDQVAMVVGGLGGVFFASDLGTGSNPVWSKLGCNFPNLYVMDIDYESSDDILLVGTFGRGAWVLHDASPVVFGGPALEIVCSADIVAATDPGKCSAVIIFPDPIVKSVCSGATLSCNPPSESTFQKGTTTVTCTATDAVGNTAKCSFTVIVKDVEPPKVTCPDPITQCNDLGRCSAVVNYSVTATDNCAGTTIVCIPSSGSTFLKGTTKVTCMATDSAGNTATCSFTVTVKDCEAPVISNVNIDKPRLWSPNHKMVDVAASYMATDNCDTPINFLTATSNEPVNGLGDGSTMPDWVIVDAHHVQLRAERSGIGTGRVYTMTITSTDSSGNSSSKTVTVNVTKNHGR